MLEREQDFSARSRNPGPEPALELLPSSALSSAQIFKAYPKIVTLENRTFHLLFIPDILTCYEQLTAARLKTNKKLPLDVKPTTRQLTDRRRLGK